MLRFAFGVLVGFAVAWVYLNRAAIKNAYNSRDKIRAAFDLAGNLDTLSS